MASELVPIRLEINNPAFSVKDTFCWNVNEPDEAIQQFAELYCQEKDLTESALSLIVTSIKRQLHVHKTAVEVQSSIPATTERLEAIKLDMLVGNIRYKDQFVWDINNMEMVPDEFALLLCEDLGLDAKWKHTISHAIREQIQKLQRSNAKASLPAVQPDAVEEVRGSRSRHRLKSLIHKQRGVRLLNAHSTGVIRKARELRFWSPECKELSEEELYGLLNPAPQRLPPSASSPQASEAAALSVLSKQKSHRSSPSPSNRSAAAPKSPAVTQDTAAAQQPTFSSRSQSSAGQRSSHWQQELLQQTLSGNASSHAKFNSSQTPIPTQSKSNSASLQGMPSGSVVQGDTARETAEQQPQTLPHNPQIASEQQQVIQKFRQARTQEQQQQAVAALRQLPVAEQHQVLQILRAPGPGSDSSAAHQRQAQPADQQQQQALRQMQGGNEQQATLQLLRQGKHSEQQQQQALQVLRQMQTSEAQQQALQAHVLRQGPGTDQQAALQGLRQPRSSEQGQQQQQAAAQQAKRQSLVAGRQGSAAAPAQGAMAASLNALQAQQALHFDSGALGVMQRQAVMQLHKSGSPALSQPASGPASVPQQQQLQFPHMYRTQQEQRVPASVQGQGTTQGGHQIPGMMFAPGMYPTGQAVNNAVNMVNMLMGQPAGQQAATPVQHKSPQMLQPPHQAGQQQEQRQAEAQMDVTGNAAQQQQQQQQVFGTAAGPWDWQAGFS